MNPDLSFVSPISGRIDLGWYVKDLLPVGHWEGQGFELEVAQEYLAEVSKNTNRILDKGIDVPYQDGHTDSALAGEGFLRDTWVGFNEDGELTIWGLSEITGKVADEKIQEGSIKNVSVGLLNDFVDGEGEHFGPAIDHVALTPFPVVHKQGEFHAAPALLELDRKALPEKIVCGKTERILMSRAGSSGVREMSVSEKPWYEIEKDTLPLSAFLLIDEVDGKTRYSLPVYEGDGPLVTKDGVTAHAGRGALNKNAVKAAIISLSIMDLDEEVLQKAAKRLLGLYMQIGESAPASLKSLAGIEVVEPTVLSKHLAIEVYGEEVSSLKELIEKREEEEERRTAWWALNDYFDAVMASDLSTADKKKELKAGIDDLIAALDLARGGALTITMRRPGDGPHSTEVGMENLLKKAFFTALCARLGVEIPDDADEEFVKMVLSKADAELAALREAEPEPKPEPKEPEPTPVATLAKEHPAVAEMATEVAELRLERQKGVLSKATEAKDTALKAGRLTEAGAEAFESLLSINGEAKRLVLSKGAVGTDTIDVRELVTTLVASLPEGAALDLEERAKRLGDLSVLKPEVKGERTEEDVEKTADEQVALARTGTAVTGGGA